MRRNRRLVQGSFLVLVLLGVFVVGGNCERWCPFGGVEALCTHYHKAFVKPLHLCRVRELLGDDLGDVEVELTGQVFGVQDFPPALQRRNAILTCGTEVNDVTRFSNNRIRSNLNPDVAFKEVSLSAATFTHNDCLDVGEVVFYVADDSQIDFVFALLVIGVLH